MPKINYVFLHQITFPVMLTETNKAKNNVIPEQWHQGVIIALYKGKEGSCILL